MPEPPLAPTKIIPRRVALAQPISAALRRLPLRSKYGRLLQPRTLLYKRCNGGWRRSTGL